VDFVAEDFGDPANHLHLFPDRRPRLRQAEAKRSFAVDLRRIGISHQGDGPLQPVAELAELERQHGRPARQAPEGAAEEPGRRPGAAHVGEKPFERSPEQEVVETQLEQLRRRDLEDVDDVGRLFLVDDDGPVVVDEHEVVLVVADDAPRDLAHERLRELAARGLAEQKMGERALYAGAAVGDGG
jgi:hypothetical protein